jgi:V8-like Glu-specific endopeptidase
MQPTFLEAIRELVGNDDLEGAVIQCLSFLCDKDPENYDNTVAIKSALRALSRERAAGNVSATEWVSLRAKYARGLLRIVDEAAKVATELRPLEQPIEDDHGEPTSKHYLEEIVGADRIMSLSWLRLGLRRARAVCRVETPKGLGTGFLLEGGLLITNHHVLCDADLAGRTLAAFNYEEDDEGTLMKAARYRLAASSFRCSEPFDCVAVRIDSPVDDAPAVSTWGHLMMAKKRPSLGDFVSIVQHPLGGPKKVAMSENQVVSIQSRVLQYTTDTLPGSSGSPVFDDAWNVVAVHHAGGDLQKAEGSQERHFVNQGILAEHVLREVAR